MNAPPNTRLNGGIAFQGAPAGVNPNAQLVKNPTQAQVNTSLQQTRQGVQQNLRTQHTQEAAADFARAYKERLQGLAIKEDPNALPGMRGLFERGERILTNTGLT